MAKFAAGGFRTVSHQTYQDRFAGQRTILKGSFSTDSGFSTTTNDFQNEYTRDGKGRLTGIKQTKQGTGGSYSVVADKNFVLGYNGQDQLIDLDRYASTSTSNLVAHTDYDRDYMGRLTKLDHLKGGTHFATYDLARDARSRITAIDSVFSNSAWNEDHDFTYDHTDQLIAADHSVQNDEAYNFTANGNRTGNQTHLGATNSSTVTADNHISTDGVFNYTQDNEGNVITKTNISTGDKQEFAYDHRNRLIKVTFKNNSNVIQKTVEYVYDHDNLMIKRTETPYTAGTPGTAQSDFYVRESAQILLAFHKNGSSDAELTNRYVWTDQIDMVLSDEQVTSLGSAGTVYYVLGDHQNSVVDLVTYNSGTDTTTVAKHRKFNAFGNTTLDSAPGITSIYGYTSMYFDVITSLQYNWHRWYDPFTGRWMGPDPIGFRGGEENLTTYVGNHPTYATDPKGLETPEGVATAWFEETIKAAKKSLLICDTIHIEFKATFSARQAVYGRHTDGVSADDIQKVIANLNALHPPYSYTPFDHKPNTKYNPCSNYKHLMETTTRTRNGNRKVEVSGDMLDAALTGVPEDAKQLIKERVKFIVYIKLDATTTLTTMRKR